MIKVLKRIDLGCRWGYEEVPNDCKTYSETVKKFGGKQTWYEKKDHCFRVDGVLYLMKKEN